MADHTAAATLPGARAELGDTLTSEQLHGYGCVHCGSTISPLTPAGYVYTTAGKARLGWAVVACPAHKQDGAA